MRILTVVKDLGLGGTQRVAQNISKGLRDQGAEVAVLAHQALGPRAAFLADAHIPVFGPLDQQGEMMSRIREWNPDVIHIHRSGYPNSDETRLMQALKRDGAPIVETNVFARFDETLPEGLIDVHSQLTIWCLLKWRMWRGSGKGASIVLPNAVDVTRFSYAGDAARNATREALGIPMTRFLFGRIGQPIATKWNPAILDVFKQGVSRGWDIGLLLIGVPDGYRQAVATLPKSVQDRIIIRDPVNDDEVLSSLYSSLDGFLHLSLIGESFGMVLCEAMLCGVPVVTLSTPLRDNSQLEIVQHGIGGYVARDLSGVLDSMEKLQADVEGRRSMGEKARASVIQRFAVPVVAAQAMRIYQILLSKDDRRPLEVKLAEMCNYSEDRRWMARSLENGFGRPTSWSNRLAIDLVHHPLLYRWFRRIKTLRSAR